MKLSNGKTSSVSRQRLKMYIAGHGHVLLPARSIFCHNYMRRQLASLKAERPAINKNNIFLVSELQVILSSHCLDICRFGDFPQVHLESRSCCSQGKHSSHDISMQQRWQCSRYCLDSCWGPPYTQSNKSMKRTIKHLKHLPVRNLGRNVFANIIKNSQGMWRASLHTRALNEC